MLLPYLLLVIYQWLLPLLTFELHSYLKERERELGLLVEVGPF